MYICTLVVSERHEIKSPSPDTSQMISGHGWRVPSLGSSEVRSVCAVRAGSGLIPS